MAQVMTLMASYKHCMTHLIAKFPPNYCIFRADFYLFCSFGPNFHLLVDSSASVKTLCLAISNQIDVEQAEFFDVDFIKS